MAIAKWFPKLTSETPLRHAARTVLASRSRAVARYLNLITTRPGEDPEHVHQLRVATRRLAAAGAVFKNYLDKPARNRLRIACRQLRRAAGALRDLDVQLAMFDARSECLRNEHSSAVARYRLAMERQRRVAERRLPKVIRGWGDQFRQAASAVLEDLWLKSRVSALGQVKLGAVARKILRKRLRKLRSATGQDLNDLVKLHQLRIAAKRLRYAMEVFAGCYPTEFRGDLYAEVEQIQTDLGDINDLRNLKSTLGKLRTTVKPRGRSDGSAECSRVVKQIVGGADRDLRDRQRDFLERWSVGKWRNFYRQFNRLLN